MNEYDAQLMADLGWEADLLTASSWPKGAEKGYFAVPLSGSGKLDKIRDRRRHYLAGLRDGMRRAQAERAQQVETVTAALREAHPVIGVEA